MIFLLLVITFIICIFLCNSILVNKIIFILISLRPLNIPSKKFINIGLFLNILLDFLFGVFFNFLFKFFIQAFLIVYLSHFVFNFIFLLSPFPANSRF